MLSLSREEFKKLVEEGIVAIPERFLKKLDNVAITVADEPTAEQLKKQKLKPGALLLGLYEGVPQTARWSYNLALPDKITIFQKPIEAVCRTEEEVKRQVRDTVWHEIAHHFGMDERRVRKAEARKNKGVKT